MKYRNMFAKFGTGYALSIHAKDGEGEGGGSGGDGTDDGGGDDTATKELEAKLAEIQAENDRLNGKIAEANKHKKAAEKAAAEKEREKAKQAGDFEQLFKSSEQQREELQAKLDQTLSSISQKEVKNTALTLASQLAEGHNVKLMARFVEERLKYTENGIKVVDSDGNLTVSSLEDLGKEFGSAEQFASLLKGSKASGGGAAGGSGGGSTKTATKAEFDKMSHAERSKFSLAGGKVTN